jgi:hypothetical protein
MASKGVALLVGALDESQKLETMWLSLISFSFVL